MTMPRGPQAVTDIETQTTSSQASHVLDAPYLLVLNIPHYVDADGAVYLDSAWHHDLKAHLAYLPRLIVASPRRAVAEATEPDLERVSCDCTFVPLPPQRSMREAIQSLPTTFARIFRAAGGVEVVHSGVAGWPYSLGWLATLSAKLRGKVLFVVVESAPWRLLEQDARPSRLARVRASVYEHLARWTCRGADLVVYTQPAFREAFPTGSRGAGHVVPATWITDRFMLSAQDAQSAWRRKGHEGPVRFLFAGRIEAFKGIHVLLGALRKLDAQGVALDFTFFGTGGAQSAVEQTMQELQHVRIHRRAPVPYGSEFFDAMDEYHVLVMPSLADEQPRILFDAAARAVSVIASDTDGIRPHLRDGETGVLVPIGDEDALAEALCAAATDVNGLKTRGLKALEYARPFTHAAMHETRFALFQKYFAPLFAPR